MTIDVLRDTDDPIRTLAVDYTATSGTRRPVRFHAPTGTLTFQPGHSAKSITIPIVNDCLIEGPEAFFITLSNPTPGVLLPNPPALRVYITDNPECGYFVVLDPEAAGDGGLVTDEAAGVFNVTVRHTSILTAPSSVNYRLVNESAQWGLGTATPGQDFTPVSGTLVFAPGETNRTFPIPILNDRFAELEEDFFIVLDHPSGGVPVKVQETRVIIRDDELNPVHVDPDFKLESLLLGCGLGWLYPVDPVPAVQPDGRIVLVTRGDLPPPNEGPGQVLIVRLLPDGRLDPTWHAATVNRRVSALVLQTNGQVLVAAGRSWHDEPDFEVNGVSTKSLLARLNADGSLDATFVAEIPSDEWISEWIPALAVQPDGKILVLTDYSLVRLNPDGSLDQSFQPGIGAGELLVQPDGSILIVNGGLIRLNSDGSLDPDYACEMVEGVLQPTVEGVQQAALQPDGRLLVLHWSGNDLRLTRLDADGKRDPTFAAVGFGLTTARFLAAADGHIWVVGRSYPFPAFLLRLEADGREDTSWRPARVTGLAPGGFSCNTEVIELPDGNLLVAGNVDMPNGQPRRGLAKLAVNVPTPRVEVDAASAVVPENGGKVPVKLVRCGDNAQPFTVTWRTEGGTAQPGSDYLPASGTVTFAANQSVATIELELRDNPLPDGDRTIRLRVEPTEPGAPAMPEVELTIANDDLGFLPGVITRLANGTVLLNLTGLPVEGSAVQLHSSDDLCLWKKDDIDNLIEHNLARFAASEATLWRYLGDLDRQFYRLVVTNSE